VSLTRDAVSCSSPANGRGSSPANPFLALRYHFGMLLGVDDFETEQAYHRGKSRLHNAWLHGEGVVWGFDVQAPEVTGRPGTRTGELRVEPGLALDAAGRELHLEAAACVELGAWFDAHREGGELEFEETEAGVRFDAHVVIRFRACLTRAVPALAEPCEGAASSTAYSRAFETVEILLRPGRAPVRSLPYHRLRLLFNLADPRTDEGGEPLPADQEVLDARAAVLALPAGEQPRAYLEAFRRFAAFDQIELGPELLPEGGSALFPAGPDAPVVLANVTGVELLRDGDRWALGGVQVDTTVRAAHVATSTIQELLCGPLFAALAGAAPDPGGGGGAGDEDGDVDDDGAPGDDEGDGGGDEDPDGEEDGELLPPGEGDFVPVDEGADDGATEDGDEATPPPDGGGPRVDPSTVTARGETIQFRVDRPLSAASVHKRRFVVSSYDRRDGWHGVEIRDVAYDRRRGIVTIHLRTAPGGNLVRLRAVGTGDRPLLGTDLVPLAGAVGGPPAGPHDGSDFVFMLKRR